jgi:hypothetical protein
MCHNSDAKTTQLGLNEQEGQSTCVTTAGQNQPPASPSQFGSAVGRQRARQRARQRGSKCPCMLTSFSCSKG